MRMIGYLGGDANTLVARKARENDVRVAVEFEDENRMLVFCVMQTGDIMMTWTEIQPTDQHIHQLIHVGTVYKQGEENDGPMYLYLPDQQEDSDEELATVHFIHEVEDHDDDE